MDDLVRLLGDTQRPEERPRKRAELDLRQAEANAQFPTLLAAIAATTRYPVEIRQSALTVLRRFIERNWSEGDDGSDADSDEGEAEEEEAVAAAVAGGAAGGGITTSRGTAAGRPRYPIAETTKQALRTELLALATRDEDERRVKTAVSYVVGKIAAVDYPAQWPDLLDTLLGVMRTGTDVQLHGALRVLSDLVEDGLGEMQFFAAARSIVEVLYQVAVHAGRRPMLRALAVSVFRNSFDLMDMVKEEHLREVKEFAQEALQGWLPFFHEILKTPLPTDEPGAAGGAAVAATDTWNGLVALKLQSVKTLLKIKAVFSSLLLPQSAALFQETWQELSVLQTAYAQLYLDQDSQSRLEDADGLPYTLDFLVLEELDLLNQCIRAPPVQKELGGQLAASGAAAHETPWMVQLMGLLVGYARITREEEDLWDIDVSLYLAEEASVTANYTARTACGDLLIKLGEWIGQRALEGLFAQTQTLFAAATPDWRSQEAALYLFTMLAGDLSDCEKAIPPALCAAYLSLVEAAAATASEPLLQARGYLAGGLLAQHDAAAGRLLDPAILAVTQAPSELVQVACIKALDGFLQAGGGAAAVPRQRAILLALREFLQSRDMDELEDADDLLATLCDALRRAIGLDAAVVLAADVPSVDLLFAIGRCGARNFHVTLIVNEAFEEVLQRLAAPAAYVALCSRVLPTLNGLFQFSDLTRDEPLITMATELVALLTQHGTEPLPAGFVAQVAPKLQRILLESTEGEILRPGAEALKNMLSHDHQQVFAWHDEQGHSGLVVCLQIIDRLLGPAIEDNSASEVGGLAAELVEKAGHQRLGDGMLQRLLQAVAARLGSATTAQLIQSLILVFARLCLTAAGEVVDFLSQIQVGQQNGLAVVLAQWLENSMSFAGYDEIRQNVIALSKLYELNDPRVAAVQVKGDLIVRPGGWIMTRSRARQNPDQYTIVPAPLKILKLLIEELASAQGLLGSAGLGAGAAVADADTGAASQNANLADTAAAGDADADDDADDGWEDDPDDLLDLSLGATKADLLGYLDGGRSRVRDDETQAFLTDFFLHAAQENRANFQDWYAQLTPAEQAKLNELAAQQRQ